MLKELEDDGFENETRDIMIRQLRRNLKNCRRVLLDSKLDLKTRERWTQLYNNTSTVLNQVLRDRQNRDWERRLRIIEEDRNRQKEAFWKEQARLVPSAPSESAKEDELSPAD